MNLSHIVLDDYLITTNPIENSKIYNVVLHYGSNGKVDEIYLYDGENNTTDMVNFGEEIKKILR